MGIYIPIPGTDYSAAVGKIGTTPLIAANDPFPVLELPGLANWWSGEDAAFNAGIMSWNDRVSGKALIAPSVLGSPSVTAINGSPVVTFDGTNDYLDVDGSVGLLTGFSLLYVLSSPNPTASQLSCVTPVDASSTAQSVYLWPGGYIGTTAKLNVAQVNSSNGKVAVSTPTIVVAAYDGAQWKFSFNGVYDKALDPASTGPGATAALFRLGASGNKNNKFTGSMAEVMQFNGNLLSSANSLYFNWLIRRLKARYAIV